MRTRTVAPVIAGGRAFSPAARTARRASRLLVALALVAAGACSRPTGPRPTPGAPTVQSRTVTVTDARLGRLTFDALAAGDASAASAGKLVVLLHGFPETDEAFREILPRLAAAGYYAVAPNQRGYSPGARPPAESDYEVTDMAGDTLAMASALGASRFHLVGHDWGGGVAWTVASMAPDRLASLTVMSTPHPDAFADAWNDPNGQQRTMSSYMNAVRGTGGDAVASAIASAATALGIPQAYAQRYRAVLGDPAAIHAAANWYRANPNPPRRIGTVDVTTRYLWGTADMYLGSTAAQATAKYVPAAKYRFQSVSGGSHWLPETKTDIVSTAILAQIQQQ